MEIPRTTAGAELLSCDLDASCLDLDCAALVDEFGEALGENPEGIEFLAHYCGLDYVEKLPHMPLGEEEDYS
jgi:hypothetical protein